MIVPPGGGRTLRTAAQQVTFKVTGEQSRSASSFEVVVPPGCPHAFANPTEAPARMFFQSSPPPDHERYFEELMDILSADGPTDRTAVAALRRRYDIEQLTPLRHDRSARSQ
ncbi:hypothetical protein ACFY7C_00070 [Streptomyces sp. NPDC012769]|uniref:hypothetical protein n=1 Tax=Streptomyces sp. NPDC012769 TaxID=3364848 RepID=UPI003695E7E5